MIAGELDRSVREIERKISVYYPPLPPYINFSSPLLPRKLSADK